MQEPGDGPKMNDLVSYITAALIAWTPATKERPADVVAQRVATVAEDIAAVVQDEPSFWHPLLITRATWRTGCKTGVAMTQRGASTISSLSAVAEAATGDMRTVFGRSTCGQQRYCCPTAVGGFCARQSRVRSHLKMCLLIRGYLPE